MKKTYIGENEIGSMGRVSKEDSKYMEVAFVISVYNPSEVKKHIDKMTLELVDYNNEILTEVKLDDRRTAKSIGPVITYGQINHINCEAKNLERVGVRANVNIEDEAKKNFKYIRLRYKTDKGKSKVIKVE